MVTDEPAPVIPVVLSDRSGTRPWTSSRSRSPRQILPLRSGLSLFHETECQAQVATPEPPVVVCDVEHRGLVEDQLGHLRVTPAAIVCEPVGRSPASVIAAAALAIGEERPGALLLVLPSDHPVSDVPQYIENLSAATLAAAAGHVVVFGSRPTAPGTGFGRGRQGPAVTDGNGGCAVDVFVERPDPDLSRRLQQEGSWLRHSGTFLVSRRVVLAQLPELEHSAAHGAEPAVGPAPRVSDPRPALEGLETALSVPVDRVALEPTERAAVLAYTGRLRDVDPSSSPEAGFVVRRPWGSYQSVDVGHHHQVKRIVVDPGHRLSLQRHRARAEHWVVVQGTASIVRGEESRVLHENESVFIPVGCAHRLENPGSTPLHLVEVQVGAYLGEDDIERLADDYGRS